jgi:hypothetical protein
VLRDDEYELMPHTELDYLRKEVERLKRNPLGDTQASITLLDSMNKLNANIARLNDILAGANDEMVKAYSDAGAQDQLRKLSEQNEKLARGIVAVAELVKELQRKQDVPTIDQFVAQHPQAMPPVQPIAPVTAPVVDAQPMVTKNPFAADMEEFTPLLNKPLPRPPATPPEQNAPGYMLQPGVRERIPDSDIPPPPRRY